MKMVSYIPGVPGGKVNILGSHSISVLSKEVYMNMCPISVTGQVSETYKQLKNCSCVYFNRRVSRNETGRQKMNYDSKHVMTIGIEL